MSCQTWLKSKRMHLPTKQTLQSVSTRESPTLPSSLDTGWHRVGNLKGMSRMSKLNFMLRKMT